MKRAAPWLTIWSTPALATGTAPDPARQLVQVLGGLGLVLALVLALAWLVKRFNGARLAGGRGLRLVGGLAVGSRERILLVEVGDTQLVVGVAPGRVQTLHVLDQPLPNPAQETENEPGFAARLAAAIQGRAGQ